MSTDLSDLDELEPAATDPVSSGDDEIRKTRAHLKNWADQEHHNTGEHKIPYGADAAQPSFGKAGRLYVNTEQNLIRRDTGTAWSPVRGVPIQTYTSLSTVDFTSTSLVSVVSFANVVVHSSQIVVVAASINWGTTADNSFGQARFQRNSVNVADCQAHPFRNNVALVVPDAFPELLSVVFFDVNPASGTYTYEIKLAQVGSASLLMQCSERNAVLLVL